MSNFNSIKYFMDYLNVKSHLNSKFVLYIIKTKNYEKFNVELIHINDNVKKTITIYKTPILSLAVKIFNNCVNNDVLFMLDSKERKNWIDNDIKETELEYYKSTPKRQVNIYTHEGYNKIELRITQHDFTFSLHSIKIDSLIQNNNNIPKVFNIIAYESRNIIDASKAFDYLVSNRDIYKPFIKSLENYDYSYFDVSKWIINSKYLSKLNNTFEQIFRINHH